MDAKLPGLNLEYVRAITGVGSRTIGMWQSGTILPSLKQMAVIETVNAILSSCPSVHHQIATSHVLSYGLNEPIEGFHTMAELCQAACQDGNPRLHALLVNGIAQFEAEIETHAKRLARPLPRHPNRAWESEYPSC